MSPRENGPAAVQAMAGVWQMVAVAAVGVLLGVLVGMVSDLKRTQDKQGEVLTEVLSRIARVETSLQHLVGDELQQPQLPLP